MREKSFPIVFMNLSKFLIFGLLVLSECFSSIETKVESRFPENYSFDKMKKIDLPNDLNEISGLEWTDKNQLWAIEDESSSIYSLDPLSGEIIDDKKFVKNTDIEDLLVIDGVAWVLESNGKLYEVKNPLQENQETVEHPFPKKKKRDFEAMVHWEGSEFIWVFCKDCSWDDGTKESSLYPFSLRNNAYKEEEPKKIKRKEFRNLPDLNEDKKYLIQPSGAAKHPFKDEIYVISSAGEWLAIFDLEFTLLDAFELDSRLFKQPEGITFDPQGNLYISNEARGGVANILLFYYQ